MYYFIMGSLNSKRDKTSAMIVYPCNLKLKYKEVKKISHSKYYYFKCKKKINILDMKYRRLQIEFIIDNNKIILETLLDTMDVNRVIIFNKDYYEYSKEFMTCNLIIRADIKDNLIYIICRISD